MTALHLASLMHRLKVIPLLLRAGANANARDADGCTPLMWALRIKGERPRVSRRGADGRATAGRGSRPPCRIDVMSSSPRYCASAHPLPHDQEGRMARDYVETAGGAGPQ